MYWKQIFIYKSCCLPFCLKKLIFVNNNLIFSLGYSTVGHIHHVPPPIPPLNYYLSSNFSHTTTLPGRRRTSQIPDLRNGSPTPSIPPPMTAISTNTYRSLQCSNYLHLWVPIIKANWPFFWDLSRAIKLTMGSSWNFRCLWKNQFFEKAAHLSDIEGNFCTFCWFFVFHFLQEKSFVINSHVSRVSFPWWFITFLIETNVFVIYV